MELFNIKDADSYIISQIENCELFDFYRIVDVETYFVYDWYDGKSIASNERCYNVWKHDKACQNCISRACVLEKKRIFKLEYFEGQIYLIMALPVTLENKPLAIELICNVTNSLVVNDSFHTQNINVHEIIKQMNDIAVRDSYTGLYNKRYAEQALCKAVSEWKSGSGLFIGVLDIDHFKQVNDTYGHVVGDEVLCVIAKILIPYAERANGWASRIGGDEFMVLWNGITPQTALAMEQELQEAVAAHVFIKNDTHFTVSISIGVVEYKAQMESWKVFQEEADQKMYISKRGKYRRLK